MATEIKQVPYREVPIDYGSILKPLNPTGAWKLKTGVYEENKMYIEHKGLLFNSWVCEDDIHFKNERKEFVVGKEEKKCWTVKSILLAFVGHLTTR